MVKQQLFTPSCATESLCVVVVVACYCSARVLALIGASPFSHVSYCHATAMPAGMGLLQSGV